MHSIPTFRSTARTHVGRVRQQNEDGFADRPQVGLWAVADGMGGHDAGEIASGMIVDALSAIDPAVSADALLDSVWRSMIHVNQTLVDTAAQVEPNAVIGSTVVTLLVFQNAFACLWAGDSRCYLLRGGTLLRITRDHSVAQALIDTGELSAEEARAFRGSNVITRAVGASPRLDLELAQGEIEAGDRYLLCSDGLTGVMEDDEIASLLSEPDLGAAADHLIAATLARGAPDNVTVVLVQAPFVLTIAEQLSRR